MTKYNCVLCDFTTVRKTEYTRHLDTKKHKEKVTQNTIRTYNVPNVYNTEKVYKCTFCENIYSSSSALARHKKACSEKDKLINNESIKDKEIERLQKELLSKDKQVETYEILLKSLTSPQTINYFNFICTTYPNPPALEGKKSYVSLLEAKTMTLIEVLTMYHNAKTLMNFIGDYIIKLYKKEEPSEQSMWSTDISRLTYIISESCKVKGSTWTYDKKGSKIKKLIIEPALNYIKEQLLKFCRENSTATEEPEFSQLKAALEIIPMINNGTLADEIAKYIAPEFYVNQSDKSEIKGDKTEIKGDKTDKLEVKRIKAAIQKIKKDDSNTKKVGKTITKSEKIKLNKKNIIIESDQESDNDSEKEFIHELRKLKASQKLKTVVYDFID